MSSGPAWVPWLWATPSELRRPSRCWVPQAPMAGTWAPGGPGRASAQRARPLGRRGEAEAQGVFSGSGSACRQLRLGLAPGPASPGTELIPEKCSPSPRRPAGAGRGREPSPTALGTGRPAAWPWEYEAQVPGQHCRCRGGQQQVPGATRDPNISRLPAPTGRKPPR